MSAETVTIDRLGAQGDGIAETATGPVYVPFALAGETAAIAREKARGTLISLRAAALERVAPPCPHYGPDAPGGACGGCNLQHLARPAYEAWKRGLVVQALQGAGIDAEVVADLVLALEGARRRVAMTARRTEKGLVLGFNRAGSHQIVPITTCLVASPGITRELATIRRVAEAVASGTKPFQVTVLETASGLDIAIAGGGALKDRQRLMAIETVLSLAAVARVTIDGEILVEPRRPVLDFGGVPVTPPPGGFVQASAAAEAVMAGLVLDHLAGAKRIADLFSGSGTFALRLARLAAVHAVEGDAAALGALDRAHRGVPGLKAVTVERRDLFRRPLMAADLKAFDAVVFDPPRAGAEFQSKELARSKVARIAAVSCNPATLARDCAILIAGGYRVERVHPIDQFLWSPHVEAVALLARR